MGIRVIAGESTSYVHSNDVSLENGRKMAKLAGQVARENRQKKSVQEFQISPKGVQQVVRQRPEQIELDDKIALLRIADAEARALDKAIKHFQLTLYLSVQQSDNHSYIASKFHFQSALFSALYALHRHIDSCHIFLK